MAYLSPQYKNDLFVSYRRASNEGPDEWVDAFCRQLEAQLRDYVGEVKIWRDTGLRSGKEWRGEIAEALDSSAVFLAIISGSYLDSNECLEELDHFLGRLNDAANEGSRQILPIFKHPPKSSDELPPELRAIGKHDFFMREDKSSPRFTELSPAETSGTSGFFRETLARVAQDLRLTLQEFKGQAQKKSLGKVFVALADRDLQRERERLRSDLQQRGYLVVPARRYLWNTKGVRSEIMKDLEDAKLCVHLVARSESQDAEMPARARLQLELAHETMKEKDRPAPLVWIQPAAETHASARELIDYIERDLANEGVEVWQRGIEDLKTHLYDQLPAAKREKAEPQVREIALFVEKGDVGALGPLKSLMVGEGFGLEPKPVKFTGSVPDDPERLARTLSSCRQGVIFWGGQSEDWVHDLIDLEALAGHRGKDRLCVYAAAPAGDEKKEFQTARARTIQAADSLNEGELRAFFGADPA